MNRRLTSRSLAISLLLALVAIAWLGGVRPVQQRYIANLVALKNGQAQLVRLQYMARFTRATKGGNKTDVIIQFKPDFLIGTRNASIIAKLQTKVRAIVVGNQSRLKSARALPEKKIGALTYLGLRLQLRGNPRNVHNIIHLIETSSPLLTIDRILLRLEHQSFSSGQVVPNLIADLDIYGAKWPRQALVSVKKGQP